MQPGQLPENEEERLAALYELEIMDTLNEQAYDDLTALAAAICGTPIALVSLLDEKRQWFKSHHGLDATETPREFAFCGHAINGDDLFYIPDSDKDERFKDNPLVTDAPYVKFYAGQPLYVKNKYKVGTLCVIDNSARELTDEQKQSLQALARQVETQLDLRLKVNELEKLDKLKDEFIAITSHELRTPLTAVSGSVKTARMKSVIEDQEKTKKLLDVASANCERLEALVNDIIDVNMLATGNMTLEKNKQHLSLTVENCCEMLNEYFMKCHVTTEVQTQDDLPLIDYDEKRIMQVLMNLLSNAAKFSPAHEVINIQIEQKQNQIQVSVIDGGCGISKDKQDMLFQKFAKINNAHDKQIKSSGLGLYISKQIIELHDGSIWYESHKPQGSIFSFNLPVSGGLK